jgi:hypothetical protein
MSSPAADWQKMDWQNANLQNKDWQTKAREQFESILLNVGLAWKAEQEKHTSSIQAGAREHFAVTLNLGLRRLRSLSSIGEVAVMAVELAAGSAEKVAVFLFQDGAARAQATRNLGQSAIEFSPNEAAAFQTAIETKDPVVAMGTPSEISRTLAERLGTEDAERVFLFPMPIGGDVKGVLFAAGNLQAGTLELIAGMAALQMETLFRPAPSKDLVNIAGLPAPKDTKPAHNAWDELSPELQSLHLKAQRKARLRVAEMQIEHRQAVQRGRTKSDLYSELREPIDAARDEFRREFLVSTPTMVDYLYLELIRGVAQGDDHLLGPSFPGPLV